MIAAITKAYDITKEQRLRLAFLSGLFVFLWFFSTLISAGSDNQIQTNYSSDYYFNAFDLVSLDAQAALVYNASTKEVVYKRNSEEELSLASLAKVMTAVVAKENLSEDFQVRIAPEDLRAAGDHGLITGELWELDAILAFMLTVSSNDAANAIAREVEGYTGESFESLMNTKAKDLGLGFSFENPSGLDAFNETKPGATGSAEDVNELMVYAFTKYPELFKETGDVRISKRSNTAWHHGENTNRVAKDIEGLLVSKTGFTDLTGGNLSVIVDKEGQEYVLTVLGADFYSRFDDILKLDKEI